MNKTHGKALSPEHLAWKRMKARCTCKASAGFKNYGGRGIRVCDRWRHSFEAFLEDMGTCPPGHSLDRIDTNGNYEPGNCRWADRVTQNNNTSRNRLVVYRGREQTLSEWCRELCLGYDRVKARLRRGDPPERAFSTLPLRGLTGLGAVGGHRSPRN
jgi:hypothetical protein